MNKMPYVCEGCIVDEALQELVRENVVSRTCDFCKITSEAIFACELDIVIQRMRECIDYEYTAPENELGWGGKDHGYIGNVLEGADALFAAIGLGIVNDELRILLERYFEGWYCTRDHYGSSESEVFKFAWSRFKDVVQHQRRYTFWECEDTGEFNEPGYDISVNSLMRIIVEHVEDLGLVVELPQGSEMWRVRVFDQGQSSKDPNRYTSPPVDKANQPNRMSPAGVPMFYTAEDFQTGYAETVEPDKMAGKEATGAKFVTLVPLNVLDLFDIQRPSSFFVEFDRTTRQAIDFLAAFADDLSRPIERDDRQHIEYVPTQVFTEYVRFKMLTPSGMPLHGIKYKSSRNGRACYVLFAEQSDCLPGAADRPRPQIVQFVDGSLWTANHVGEVSLCPT